MAQLVRAPPCHGGGRGFESLLGRQYFNTVFNFISHGIIAQLGEHLPYKQGVTGSSPVGPIIADVAQLAEQLICNQQVIGSSPIVGFCLMWRQNKMDGFPRGQRGQTVNLLATLSKVRILLHPFFSERTEWEDNKIISRDGAVWKLVGLITRRSLVQIQLPQLMPR